LTIATGPCPGRLSGDRVYTHRHAAGGFAPHLFPLLGITETVRAPAREYIQLLNLSALPLLIYVAFRRYLQGSGK